MYRQLDTRAFLYGLMAAGLNVAAIYFGSGRMAHFDWALLAYTAACVFAAFGIVYRYTVWLQKPPTKLYWRKGWALFLRPSRLPGNALHLAKLLVSAIGLQTFIERRSHLRWAAHFLISWGVLVALAVTVPLVFGWVHFAADPARPDWYIPHFFGIAMPGFPAHSAIGWVTFHVLDFCAVAILIGMFLAMKRRLGDPGAKAVQQFAMDFLPLILLFAISITGLMLTASVMWFKAYSYAFLAFVHAFFVIVWLLNLPFGKFFHIFQRPAHLGVQFYKQEGARTGQAACARCGEEFASMMHVEDLKGVLGDLGFDYTTDGGGHYQDVCPRCRRTLLATTQREAIGGPGFL